MNWTPQFYVLTAFKPDRELLNKGKSHEHQQLTTRS